MLYDKLQISGLNTVIADSDETNLDQFLKARQAYVKTVSDCSGIPADEPVRADDRKTMIAIACGISHVENGTEVVMNDVRDGWNLL